MRYGTSNYHIVRQLLQFLHSLLFFPFFPKVLRAEHDENVPFQFSILKSNEQTIVNLNRGVLVSLKQA